MHSTREQGLAVAVAQVVGTAILSSEGSTGQVKPNHHNGVGDGQMGQGTIMSSLACLFWYLV